ncbi:MAG: HD domain-containing protein [Patescibacteria group bacterium]|nr:HD domain-containing protein [Patescibacteria group bacterium]
MIFQNYIASTRSLDELVGAAFDGLRIDFVDQARAMAFLAPLKHKSPITFQFYEHCLRTGLVALAAATHLQMSRQSTVCLFLSGLLHDIGKDSVPLSVLGKMEPWVAEDYAALRPHPMDAYRRLVDVFPDVADVVVRHHRFQPHAYPDELPPLSGAMEAGLVESLAGVISLVDLYDSLHRVHDRHHAPTRRTGEQIRQCMLEIRPEQAALTRQFYEAGLFTTVLV